MKNPTRTSIPHGRRTLVAAIVALLAGAVPAVAQSGNSGSSTSNQKNTPSTSDSSPSSSTGTGYQSGATSSDTTTTPDQTGTSSSSTGAGAMTGRDTTASHGKLAWSDRRFVTKAAEDGMDEVQLAQLAAQRATNAEVRTYAQKLMSEHQQVNSELTQMAGQKNVKLDKDNEKDRAYKRLSKKSGADFDQEFVEHMIDEHEKDIKLFEKAAKDAKDPDVRSFASKNLEHLRDHLQQAQGLRQTLMPTGHMDDTSGRGTSGSSTTTPPSTSSTPTSSSTDTSTTTPDSSSTPKRDTPR